MDLEKGLLTVEDPLENARLEQEARDQEKSALEKLALNAQAVAAESKNNKPSSRTA